MLAVLGYEKKNYEAGNKFLSDGDLRKILTVMKSEKEYQWLNDYSAFNTHRNPPVQTVKRNSWIGILRMDWYSVGKENVTVKHAIL